MFVTEDFVNVVHGFDDLRRDEYLRPVNWILSSTITKEILVISPYKADKLFTELECQFIVRLHVYTPKITKTMVSLRLYNYIQYLRPLWNLRRQKYHDTGWVFSLDPYILRTSLDMCYGRRTLGTA